MIRIIILSLFFSQVWMSDTAISRNAREAVGEVVSPCAIMTERLPPDFVNCAAWNTVGGLCLQNLGPNEIKNLDQCHIDAHSYLPGLSVVLGEPTDGCNPFYLTVTHCLSANSAELQSHNDKRNATNAKRGEKSVKSFSRLGKLYSYNTDTIVSGASSVETTSRFAGTGARAACHCNPSGNNCINVRGSCLPLCAASDCSRVQEFAPKAAAGLLQAPSLFVNAEAYYDHIANLPDFQINYDEFPGGILGSFQYDFGFEEVPSISSHLNVFYPKSKEGFTKSFPFGQTKNYISTKFSVPASTIYKGASTAVKDTLAKTEGQIISSTNLKFNNFDGGLYDFGKK